MIGRTALHSSSAKWFFWGLVCFCVSLTACETPQVHALEAERSSVEGAAQRGLRASLRVMTPNGSAGSGFFIHPNGLAVTNAHVVEGDSVGSVQLVDGDAPGAIAPFEVIARGPSRDLALLRVSLPHAAEYLPLGFSAQARLGGDVVAVGAPQGMFPVVTRGLLAGRSRPGMIGPLLVPQQLIHSAPTLRGSSGCPIISQEGLVIGIQSAKPGMELVKLSDPLNDAGRSFDEELKRWSIQTEGFGLAVPVDDLRALAAAWVAPEWSTGLATGFDCDPFSSGCLVVEVEADSPAARAGLVAGDSIVLCNSAPVLSVVDLAVALAAPHTLSLGVIREGEQLDLRVDRSPWLPPEHQTLSPGLLWREVLGHASELVGIRWRDVARRGIAEKLELDKEHSGRDAFAIEYLAWLEVPESGLWTFELQSDDGSQLYLRDKLVVDCDGLHARLGARGEVFLEAGLQPVRVLYFEAGGEESLVARWGLAEQELSVIPAEAFFHEPSIGW